MLKQLIKFKFLELFIDSLFNRLIINLTPEKRIRFNDLYKGMKLKEIRHIKGTSYKNCTIIQKTNTELGIEFSSKDGYGAGVMFYILNEYNQNKNDDMDNSHIFIP